MQQLSESSIKDLISNLNANSISYRTNVNLSILCSFKIGGISPLVIEPENNEMLLQALNGLKKYDLPYKILGGGTNLLISDFPNDFITLRLSGEFKDFSELEKDSGKFTIGAAALTTPTFRKISQMGYTGMEFMSTIPGWLGGAVIQNAGCYGGELFDFIDTLEVLQNGNIHSFKKSEVDYGYRYTQFLKNKDSIITKINVTLLKGNLEEIEASLKDKRDRRNSSQPENKKSAGSVFKNPKGLDEEGKPLKSWFLIDQVGLRGLIKGGAQISPEHCNFIVNTGGARASDVAYLARTIQDKVFEKYKIQLEREVEYFGKIDF
ncbi:MAG: UDP-N-acetylmuramate dehydrogenase [Leptospiraceae bacterium]|nr:UDP-N-acetylmuramate dehydrogenase [Leptospiraceae bacterium]